MSSFLETAETSHQDDTSTQQTSQGFVDHNSQQEDAFLKVGDRVFNSPEDAVKHISSAQDYISKLEKDWEAAAKVLEYQDRLLDKATKADEVLDAVKNRDSSDDNQDTPALNKEEFIKEAVNAFDRHQDLKNRQMREEENLNTTVSALKSAYGERTDEVVQKVAEENGLSIDQAINMARTTPKVFIKMFDLKSSSDATVNESSVNTQAVANKPSQNPRRSIMNMGSKERAAYIQQRLSEIE